MSSPPIKAAVIGLGSVAISRNLPIMTARPDYEVYGVIDRNPEHVATIGDRFGVSRQAAATSLADVAWIEDVDLVLVGTGPQSHYRLIGEALRMRKDVLTEKPFTMTVAEGEDLVALAREHEQILAIVHNFQFAHSTQRLIADIDSGRLGTIKLITARQYSNPRRNLPAWYDELPQGLFYDESPHFFYLLKRIAPSKLEFLRSEIFPSTAGRNTPAWIEANYRSLDSGTRGVPVKLEMNFEAGISEWHLSVFGDRALGDVDVFRDIYMRLPNDESHSTITTFRTSAYATAQHLGQHFTRGLKHLRGQLRYGTDEVFDRLAMALRTRRDPDGIGAADALDVLRMQHQAIEMAETL